jgi:hypothetical protein
MPDEKFNPLNPKQAAPAGSFAAKRAARDARKAGGSTEDALANIEDLSEEERYQITRTASIQQAAKDFSFAAPEMASERIGIVFDDSGSMAGGKIQDAIEGVTEFMRDCVPNETAVSVFPISLSDNHYRNGNPRLPYSCNLPSHASDITKYTDQGGTPLFKSIRALLAEEMKPSRLIVFSDGQPDEGESGLDSQPERKGLYSEEIIPATPGIINDIKAAGIVCDTCYIANSGFNKEFDTGYKIMKRLAEETGGIFMVFERGKCSFKHGFKFLTKSNRLLLADASFKTALEEGRV